MIVKVKEGSRVEVGEGPSLELNNIDNHLFDYITVLIFGMQPHYASSGLFDEKVTTACLKGLNAHLWN